MPSKPGVYLFKNADNKILYVGKAKNLKKRVASYFSKSAHDAKTTLLVAEVKKIDHIVVNSEIEAFLLEAELIKTHKPYYNIKMIDDKSYPYIMISENVIPYVAITRKKVNAKATLPYSKSKGKVPSEASGSYFGPYPDAGSVKVVLKLLRRIFPYESVRNHTTRKCLYYHLGLCPCVQAVPDNSTQYKRNIRYMKQFLGGKTKTLLVLLLKEQKKSTKEENFEQSAVLQKQIDSIKKITEETYDPFIYLTKPDAQLERELNENLDLQKLLAEYGLDIPVLKRIECYDISNFQGTNATGSMTVFINGSSTNSEYRKFRIRRPNTPDDFAMHQEVISRRLKHLEDWGMPDLLIIDGGKGQVSSVMEVLAHLNVKIPVIGLAKKFETIIVPEKVTRGYEFIEVRVPLSRPALNLVRRIRDEAHRFAITYHRKLRSKNMFI